MPLFPRGANRTAKMKALVKQSPGLSLGALIGLFFADKNLDLLGQQRTYRRTATSRKNLRLANRLAG
jgi:hypothetical protein